MFIRRTATRRRGEHYFTFRLVRSERTGSKVRQRTLLNLGRHFDVAPGQWPTLCRRIDDLLAGQWSLPPDFPPALESHAQRIAARLLASERIGAAPSQASQGHDFQSIAVDTLELIRPRCVGVEHVGLWAMDQLGLRAMLEGLGVGASLRAAAVGSVIVRMARPGSERAARRWLGERSALGELVGVDFATMGPMRLYRASDALMAHREAIERRLFEVAPVWWTPEHCAEEVSRWQKDASPTRRSTGARWWSWFGRAARPGSWLGSSSARRRRSATGCVSRTATRVVARTV